MDKFRAQANDARGEVTISGAKKRRAADPVRRLCWQKNR